MRVYHVSHTWKDETITVEPREMNRVPGEPTTPRICVAPTIEECILAIGTYEDVFATRDVSVYVADTDCVVKPTGVSDADVTREMWLLTPHTFRRIKSIPAGTLRLPASPDPMMPIAKLRKLAPKLLDAIEEAVHSM